MKKQTIISIFILFLAINITACKKKGCTDPIATNYSESAEVDNGSCIYGETTIERISYGADDRQHFDLFLPYGHTTATKTVILIHGGAWTLGPQDEDSILFFNQYLKLTDKLLNEGYAVAEMKYRLACYTENESNLTGDPNFYMNQMLEDVDAVITRLKSDGSTLGVSSNEFALIGESAGAHIALMYALRESDTDLKTVISFYAPTQMDDEAFKTSSSTLFNALDIDPTAALNDHELGCNFRTTGTMNVFWALNSFVGKKLELGTTYPEFTDTLSPAYPNNIVRNLPVFLMHGEIDNLVPKEHADYLIEALTTKFGTSPASISDFNAQHKLKKYNNCGHGWIGLGCSQSQVKTDVIKWLKVHF